MLPDRQTVRPRHPRKLAACLAALATFALAVAAAPTVPKAMAAMGGDITFTYKGTRQQPGGSQEQFSRISVVRSSSSGWGCLLFCSQDSLDSSGAWSRDGKGFAFTKSKKSQGGHQVFYADYASGKTVQVSFDDTTTAGIEQHDRAVFSPDGKYLATIRFSESTDLGDGVYIHRADGGGSVSVAGLASSPGQGRPAYLAWHPTENRLAVVWNRFQGTASQPTSDLYTYQLTLNDGAPGLAASVAGQRQLTEGVQAQAPDWSPDGKRIVFAIQEDEYNSDIYQVRSNGALNSYDLFAEHASEPKWSPDGGQILFTGFEEIDEPLPGERVRDLYVKKSKNGEATNVTGLYNYRSQGELGTAEGPAWRPRGCTAKERRQAGRALRRAKRNLRGVLKSDRQVRDYLKKYSALLPGSERSKLEGYLRKTKRAKEKIDRAKKKAQKSLDKCHIGG